MQKLSRIETYPANDHRVRGIHPLAYDPLKKTVVWSKRLSFVILSIFLLLFTGIVSTFWLGPSERDEGLFDIVLNDPAPRETLSDGRTPSDTYAYSGLQVIVEEEPFPGASGDNKVDARELAQRARRLMMRGQTQKALRYERQALKFDPANMLYRLELAIMYDHISDKDNAVDLYLDVIEAYEKDDKTLPLDLDIESISRRMNYLVTAGR